MPTRPPKLCPRCLAQYRGRRCPRCNPPWSTTTPRDAVSRGAIWKRWRVSRFAEQDYLCAVDGCRALCAVLDHIVPIGEGGEHAYDNTQGLCVPHHDAKTQREAQRAKQRRRG